MGKPVPYLLSELAQRSADRYSIYLSALRGIVRDGVKISGRQAGVDPTLSGKLSDLRLSYIPRETEQLHQDVSQIALRAHTDASIDLGVRSTDFPEEAAGLSIDGQESLSAALGSQARRDENTAANEVRRMAMRLNMMVRLEGGSMIGAALKLDRKHMSPDFGTLDRAGRKWSSANLIRTVYRHQLLTTYNDVYLWTLANHGDSKARVKNVDPNHRYNGLAFDIVGPPEAMTYDAIRAEVFHPNSNSVAARL